jgi:uncharacterized membrane protein
VIRLEHLTFLQAIGLFAVLAVPIVLLGVRSMAGLGPVRRWVALGARLVLLLMLILLLAGVQWSRVNKDVQVIAVRDVSASTSLVRPPGNESLSKTIDEFLRQVWSRDPERVKELDRIGLVSFDQQAYFDADPANRLDFGARATREGRGGGTDVAGAIQLALARSANDAMNRIVLFWDGNATQGDLESAIKRAAAAKVPIDVVPLTYDAQNEVIVERIAAPAWRKENEPFGIDVVLRSTNSRAQPGRLVLMHQGKPLRIGNEPDGGKRITLNPGPPAGNGRTVERVQVPALPTGGVHQFEAIFYPDEAVVGGRRVNVGDTLVDNNRATAFTFVRGKGSVLFVDNAPNGRGKFLRDALKEEGIIFDEARTSVDQFPLSLVDLQNYDAVILSNVPRGAGGISELQEQMLTSYVKDMGGGLLMVGGPNTFGAGGWSGSRLEAVLPVDMDVPAKRMIPKGALVLLMHSCEMNNGNFWGVQCGIKAVEALSPRDEIGVTSFGWKGVGGGGTVWDFPLEERGDGTKPIAALKNMQLGDMPSFHESMNVILNGDGQHPGLKQSTAKQKHVIVISDGDPQPPSNQLMQDYKDAGITVSTVMVYPHGGVSPTMQDIAEQLGGESYGPIESNPDQLPQIFVKEATVVRRSLITEDAKGMPVREAQSASEFVRGIDLSQLPPVYGFILTTKKSAAQVEMPLVVETASQDPKKPSEIDPLLAHWQIGLGKAAVFTADAHDVWLANWVPQPFYRKFWSQIVRGVSKPVESSDFDTQVTVEGNEGRVVVEAMDANSAFRGSLGFRGTISGPDGKPIELRLSQTKPGVYEARFKASDAGNYVMALAWQSPDGKSGRLLGGTVVNSSPEMRDLRSNLAAIKEVAERTGGRVLDGFNTDGLSLFTREGLSKSNSPRDIREVLIPLILAMVLIDIAIRRIAWDWNATKRMAQASVNRVKSYTTTRKVETTASVDALRDIRGRKPSRGETAPSANAPRPTSEYKFEASSTDKPAGDLSSMIGGATDKPVSTSKPATERPKGEQGDKGGGMGSLMEAKRRAQQKIRDAEEGKK